MDWFWVYPLAVASLQGIIIIFLHWRTNFFFWQLQNSFAIYICLLFWFRALGKLLVYALSSISSVQKEVRVMVGALSLAGLSLVETASRNLQSSWYRGEQSAWGFLCLISTRVKISKGSLSAHPYQSIIAPRSEESWRPAGVWIPNVSVRPGIGIRGCKHVSYGDSMRMTLWGGLHGQPYSWSDGSWGALTAWTMVVAFKRILNKPCGYCLNFLGLCYEHNGR